MHAYGGVTKLISEALTPMTIETIKQVERQSMQLIMINLLNMCYACSIILSMTTMKITACLLLDPLDRFAQILTGSLFGIGSSTPFEAFLQTSTRQPF